MNLDAGGSRHISGYDLVVRNGKVIGDLGFEVTDIGVAGGKIRKIGGSASGRAEIDAGGKLVLPGGIDMHVHLTPMASMSNPTRPDGFESGSWAAASGGITTIGNMTHQRPGESLLSALRRERLLAERESVVDFLLHPVLNDPSEAANDGIAELASEGFGTLKIFMVFPSFRSLRPRFVDALRRAADAGLLVLIHCEDPDSIERSVATLVREGRVGAQSYPLSRPLEAEVSAVSEAVELAEYTGAAIHVVHLSSEAALEVCRQARRRGVNVSVETRPLYLHVTDSVFAEQNAPLFIGNPPPRGPEDRVAMWNGLVSGDIDALASDHAPWNKEDKVRSAADVRNALPGLPELDTMLPMLFSEGVVSGRMTLSQFTRVTASSPAHLLRIQDSKGKIAVGADADLTLWDPHMIWTIDGLSLATRTDHSPYDGWKVQGAVEFTIVRGAVVRDPGGPLPGSQQGEMVPAHV